MIVNNCWWSYEIIVELIGGDFMVFVVGFDNGCYFIMWEEIDVVFWIEGGVGVLFIELFGLNDFFWISV